MFEFTYTMSANLYVNNHTGTKARTAAELPPPSQDAPASAAGEGWGGGQSLHRIRGRLKHRRFTYTPSAQVYV